MDVAVRLKHNLSQLANGYVLGAKVYYVFTTTMGPMIFRKRAHQSMCVGGRRESGV